MLDAGVWSPQLLEPIIFVFVPFFNLGARIYNTSPDVEQISPKSPLLSSNVVILSI